MTFIWKNKEYSLVRYLEPIMLVGKQIPDYENEYSLLADAEAEELYPIIEDVMVKRIMSFVEGDEQAETSNT